jgi:hypothetical protein
VLDFAGFVKIVEKKGPIWALIMSDLGDHFLLTEITVRSFSTTLGTQKASKRLPCELHREVSLATPFSVLKAIWLHA